MEHTAEGTIGRIDELDGNEVLVGFTISEVSPEIPAIGNSLRGRFQVEKFCATMGVNELSNDSVNSILGTTRVLHFFSKSEGGRLVISKLTIGGRSWVLKTDKPEEAQEESETESVEVKDNSCGYCGDGAHLTHMKRCGFCGRVNLDGDIMLSSPDGEWEDKDEESVVEEPVEEPVEVE